MKQMAALYANEPGAKAEGTVGGTSISDLPASSYAYCEPDDGRAVASRCHFPIKDRNGNYLSMAYDTFGHVSQVTDTLGRVFTFERDAGGNLTSIVRTAGDARTVMATFGRGTAAYMRIACGSGASCSSTLDGFPSTVKRCSAVL